MLNNRVLREELGIDHWRLKSKSAPKNTAAIVDSDSISTSIIISEEQKVLITNILKAIKFDFNENNLIQKTNGVVSYSLSREEKLVFDSVEMKDISGVTYLSSIEDLLSNPEQKKKTWFKLKNKFL